MVSLAPSGLLQSREYPQFANKPHRNPAFYAGAPHRPGHGSEHLLHQRRRIDGARVRKEITVAWDDGRTLGLTEDVRLYTPEEMQEMLGTCGLHGVAWYGSFSGEEFSVEAPRMIVVARRSS